MLDCRFSPSFLRNSTPYFDFVTLPSTSRFICRYKTGLTVMTTVPSSLLWPITAAAAELHCRVSAAATHLMRQTSSCNISTFLSRVAQILYHPTLRVKVCVCVHVSAGKMGSKSEDARAPSPQAGVICQNVDALSLGVVLSHCLTCLQI